MSSFDPSSPSPSRSRRRLAAWLAFGVAGLATGAVWASGFASATAVNEASPGASPALTKTDAAARTSTLSTTVSKVSDITFDWEGRWGAIAADTTVFKVDLSDEDAANTYNIALLLANPLNFELTGWATLQLKIQISALAADTADCSTATYTSVVANDPKVLDTDQEDAGVYYNSLDGDAVYCIGVQNSTGSEQGGTFLRAATDTPPTEFPDFIATVDRKS